MKQIDNEELKRVQVGILKKVDELCIKHNIKYFIDFGTLLGAIRHGGYIPWDDDIDISVPRKEFKTFLKVIEEDGEYQVIFNQNDYYFMFARICDKRTCLELNGIPKIENFGVFIDVFPIDNIPDNYQEQVKYLNFNNKLNRNLFFSCKIKQLSTLNNKDKIVYLIEKIKRRSFSFRRKKLRKKLLNHMILYEGTTNTVGFVTEGFKYKYPKEYYESTIRVRFEDIYVNIPGEYDEILKIEYGDYHKIPPIEEQKSHHHFKPYWK